MPSESLGGRRCRIQERHLGRSGKSPRGSEARRKLDAEELTRYCKESLASDKTPKVFTFVDALPRTGLGKIDRGKLNALVERE